MTERQSKFHRHYCLSVPGNRRKCYIKSWTRFPCQVQVWKVWCSCLNEVGFIPNTRKLTKPRTAHHSVICANTDLLEVPSCSSFIHLPGAVCSSSSQLPLQRHTDGRLYGLTCVLVTSHTTMHVVYFYHKTGSLLFLAIFFSWNLRTNINNSVLVEWKQQDECLISGWVWRKHIF